MRLSNVFSGRGWFPEHKVKFQAVLPLRLKDKVSGKSEKEDQSACVQEMMNLMSCLKKNDYYQSPCSQELDVMNKCFKNHQITSQAHKENMKLGILTPDAKTLTHHQVNVLLKKFSSVK